MFYNKLREIESKKIISIENFFACFKKFEIEKSGYSIFTSFFINYAMKVNY